MSDPLPAGLNDLTNNVLLFLDAFKSHPQCPLHNVDLWKIKGEDPQFRLDAAAVAPEPSAEECQAIGHATLPAERRRDLIVNVYKNTFYTNPVAGRMGVMRVASLVHGALLCEQDPVGDSWFKELCRLAFEHRMHTVHVVSTIFCVLEYHMKTTKLPVINSILQVLKDREGVFGSSIHAVVARLICHTPAQDISWCRVLTLAHLVRVGLVNITAAWNAVASVAPESWIEDAKKFHAERMTAAKAKKTGVSVDRHSKGELEFLPATAVPVPASMSANIALDFISALIRIGCFSHAVSLLKQHADCHVFAYCPEQHARRLSTSALRAIKENIDTCPMSFVLRVGHYFSMDIPLFNKLLSMPRYLNNDRFILHCAMPSIIASPQPLMGIVAKVPKLMRVITSGKNAVAPEVVAVLQKFDELVTYVLRRTTAADGARFSHLLSSILIVYPFSVVDRVVDQALGYDDSKLMATQSCLFTEAPASVVTMVFESAYAKSLELEKTRGLLASNGICAVATLVAILWRRKFFSMDADRVIQRLLSCPVRLVTMCFLKAILEHMLFMPMFSEGGLVQSQRDALACGPVTMWMTCGSFDLFLNTQEKDDVTLSLRKWYTMFQELRSVFRSRRTHLDNVLGLTEARFFENNKDGDVMPVGSDLLAEVRKRHDICADVCALLCSEPKPAMPEDAQLAFWRLSVRDIHYPEKNYSKAVELLRTRAESIASKDTIMRIVETIKAESDDHKQRYHAARDQLQSNPSQLVVTYQHFVARVRANPKNAIYSAMFLLLSKHQTTMISNMIKVILTYIPAFSHSDSACVGLALQTILADEALSGPEGLGFHASVCHLLLTAFGLPHEKTQHNALSILQTLQPAYPVHAHTANLTLAVLDRWSQSSGPLQPQSIRLAKGIRERSCSSAHDGTLHTLMSNLSISNIAPRQRKRAANETDGIDAFGQH